MKRGVYAPVFFEPPLHAHKKDVRDRRGHVRWSHAATQDNERREEDWDVSPETWGVASHDVSSDLQRSIAFFSGHGDTVNATDDDRLGNDCETETQSVAGWGGDWVEPGELPGGVTEVLVGANSDIKTSYFAATQGSSERGVPVPPMTRKKRRRSVGRT